MCSPKLLSDIVAPGVRQSIQFAKDPSTTGAFRFLESTFGPEGRMLKSAGVKTSVAGFDLHPFTKLADREDPIIGALYPRIPREIDG